RMRVGITSQERLAHLAGAHRTYSGRLERGESGVAVERLAASWRPCQSACRSSSSHSSSLQPTGPATPRVAPSVSLDPLRGRLVVFSLPDGLCWALYRRIAPAAVPGSPPRCLMSECLVPLVVLASPFRGPARRSCRLH